MFLFWKWLDDGRMLVYGNMGGDGQPQSQGHGVSPHRPVGMNPQAAITALAAGPHLGPGQRLAQARITFPRDTVDSLYALGHVVDVVQPYDEVMGHAGAIIHHADGSYEGGTDPRSDGAVAGW